MPDEIEVATKDSTQATDQTPTSEKESTSKTPEPYTKVTQDKAVSDALSRQGREHKEALEPITKERDTFKSQAEQATTDLKDTESKITDLETDLEEAIGEDADLRDIKKIKTELRAERDKHRQEARTEREAIAELRKTADAEREEWAGTVAEAQTFKFDGELAKLVDEYDGDVTANFTKLKNAGVKNIEDARATAETFLTKKVEEPALVDDSGVTSGGSLSDKAFIKKLGEGGETITKDDMVRAKKLGIIS